VGLGEVRVRLGGTLIKQVYNAGWTFEDQRARHSRSHQSLRRSWAGAVMRGRTSSGAGLRLKRSPYGLPQPDRGFGGSRSRSTTTPPGCHPALPPSVDWTYRRVLDHLLMVERTGKLVYYASLRDIAKLTGIGLGTVDRAQQRARSQTWRDVAAASEQSTSVFVGIGAQGEATERLRITKSERQELLRTLDQSAPWMRNGPPRPDANNPVTAADAASYLIYPFLSDRK
jgi:hypothetical protein